MVDTLYTYAKFQYECGNYSGAAEYLYFVRVLVSMCSLQNTQEELHNYTSKIQYLRLVRNEESQNTNNVNNIRGFQKSKFELGTNNV